jgi:ATP-dependent Lhr-like helicase
VSLARFHPLVAGWFAGHFHAPTPAQAAGWDAIAQGHDTLIAAPTGSGKTLAAFLWSLDTLIREGAAGGPRDETYAVYVSPLKALGNDIQRNLVTPLEELRDRAAAHGGALPAVRVAVRSGDTPAADRARMVRRPPHILITTPESLYILLTAQGSRDFLRSARTVIVDEIHAIAGDKRGAHLALSLERLDALTGRRCQRIGLSATQRPIDEIARLLVGVDPAGHARPCTIVDTGHRRPWQLSVEVPGPPRGPIATHEMWEAIYDRLAVAARAHRTTLVFVNTRRLVERVAHHLTLRLGEGQVAAHHGSLSRRTRLDAEERLRTGRVAAVVATASLELGIDIGHVDLVCHLGAPRAIATLLQRVGRSGHRVAETSKGILFPLTRDDLLQAAAAIRAARAGELDGVVVPQQPLDILSQQIVAAVAAEEIGEETLWDLVRRAYPFRALPRREFDQVIEALSEGVARRLGRTTALVHRDGVHRVLRPRRGARLAAITCGGAIPDTADYDVILEPDETVVGTVNEDFAIESMAGDTFLLGNTSWRIRRVEAGRVRVVDARGAPPSVPFWLGEAPARSPELSAEVARLRTDLAARLADPAGAQAWLEAETGVDAEGAAQAVQYVAETVAALGCVPSQRTIVAERFFDEAGGMQIILHTPFGARINRAWGLALRKRFCLTFDFELQAAATDDGIVLSLGQQHSFPLDTLFAFVRTQTAEADLVQAMLATPLFTTRWRWNATRALALLRHTGGRRVPMPIRRMRAEDLLAAVFPEQVGCQDNHMGPITPPDHPLVTETVRNCLYEAMDLDGLRGVLAGVEAGRVRTVAIDTPTPSPIAQEILHANPYAFLDDAPLEERRARAVSMRRADPDLARGVGALDPAAIAEVRAQAWPDVRDADDLHDQLLTVGILPVEDASWATRSDGAALAASLITAGRATLARWHDQSGAARSAYVAAERTTLVAAAVPGVRFEPPASGDATANAGDEVGQSDAIRDIVHGWVQGTGPTTAAALSARIGLPEPRVDAALAALEGAGTVLRGRFAADGEATEWCERRLLARIHRLTLGRLRREIEPVSPAVFVRFLLRWQHVYPGTQLHGRDGVAEAVGLLQGTEAPARAWEDQILPARIREYNPADLDALCLGGTVTWGRIVPQHPAGDDEPALAVAGRRPRAALSAAVPITLLLRDDLPVFLERRPDDATARLSHAAADVVRHLRARGASFLPDIARAVRRMPADVEAALWELVAAGLVTGDGLAGLRRRVNSSARAPRARRPLTLVSARATAGSLPAGRWALWDIGAEPLDADARTDALAGQLLRRYGVVLRELALRERCAPPWRSLLDRYRRWEAQGRIRGGRFVAGFTGEQFALPEAVEALRAVRRGPEDGETVVIGAADPLNVTGSVLPGTRVLPAGGLAIALRQGAVVDVAPRGALLARLGHARARMAMPTSAG